jgi:membrane protease YdiL (CAAX protease family)
MKSANALRAATGAALPAAAVVFAAVAAALTSTLLVRDAAQWSVLMAAGLFLLLAAAALLESVPRVSLVTCGRNALAAAASALVFGLSARALMQERLPLGAVTLVTLFAAALAEESVFRVWLPASLIRAWRLADRRGLPAAVLIAQCVFAICHVLPLSTNTAIHPVADVPRLILVGCLYAVLVHEAGVWASACVHASMNAALETQDVFWSAGAFDVRIAAGVIAVLVIVGLLQSKHLRRATARREVNLVSLGG